MSDTLYQCAKARARLTTITATYPPRRMVMNRGSRAVKSDPAEMANRTHVRYDRLER